MLTDHISLVLLIGILISLSLWTKALLHMQNLPPLIGYVFLGWMLRMLNDSWEFLPETAPQILYFMSDIGIITLLFRIGFGSHIKTLLAQLSRASILAISNIVTTAILGFYLSYSILSIHPVGALFIAIALTATSIGITITIWKDNKILNSKTGALLLDLVALDDVIGIILMGILIQLAPMFLENTNSISFSSITLDSLLVIGKLFLFLVFCILFSVFVVPKLTHYLKKSEHMPDPMVTIIAFGIM
ncbi:MAG: cation:proton antiporter, partial [Waddliaceae bacterium]